MGRTTTPEQQRERLAKQLDDLQQRRSGLAGKLAAAEAGWAASLAAGEATDKHTEARRRHLAEIEDTESEIGRVRGWMAEVDATIERARREAAYTARCEAFDKLAADAVKRAEEYEAATWQALQDTIAAAKRVHEAYKAARALQTQAQGMAEEIRTEAAALYGQDVSVGMPDVLGQAHQDRWAEHSATSRYHLLRLFDATTKSAALTAQSLGEAAAGEVGR